MPVMVIVDWPVAVEPLTVSVNVLVEVVGLVLNDAATPLGIPLALRVTSLSKPPAGTIVIVLVPLLPCATVKILGEAVSVKLPNPSTVSVSVVVALRLPEVPVIVAVAFPFFAVALAVRVRVLIEVAGSGLKEAVTPVGSPEAASVTLPENPLSGVMVMLLLPLAPPCVMVTAFGEAERLKVFRAFTVRLSTVVFLSVPEVPVIVTVAVPVAAVALAVKVSVLLLVAGLGLNAAVTSVGSPEAASVTLPENPLSGVMVMLLLPLAPPCVMVTAFGEAERLKVFRAFTVRLSTVVFLSVPDVPVIVTVAVPVAAVALAVKVSVLLLVAGLGLNAAVTSVGSPEAASVTLPENPLTGVMVMLLLPLAPPCVMVTLLGLAVSVKPAGQLFTRL